MRVCRQKRQSTSRMLTWNNPIVTGCCMSTNKGIMVKISLDLIRRTFSILGRNFLSLSSCSSFSSSSSLSLSFLLCLNPPLSFFSRNSLSLFFLDCNPLSLLLSCNPLVLSFYPHSLLLSCNSLSLCCCLSLSLSFLICGISFSFCLFSCKSLCFCCLCSLLCLNS